MKISSCKFERSAFREEDEPRDARPSVVFLGRSNVGKSSLINRLLGTKGLARTSSRPGRTQSVNYYSVNQRYRFIDLPGYGYAKVPESVRRQWGPMVESFLERNRSQISLALLIVDSRHAPSRLDLVMHQWLVDREIPYIVAVTKSDKLSGNGRAKASRVWTEGLDPKPELRPVLTSAENGLGIGEIWKCIDQALAGKRAGNKEPS